MARTPGSTPLDTAAKRYDVKKTRVEKLEAQLRIARVELDLEAQRYELYGGDPADLTSAPVDAAEPVNDAAEPGDPQLI